MSIFRTGLGPLAAERMTRAVVGSWGSRCVVRRRVGETSDGRGASTPVYEDQPACACEVQYSASSEEAYNQRYEGRIMGTIFLPPEAVISEHDLIRPISGPAAARADHQVAGPAFISSDDPGLAVPVVLTTGDVNP